jgi:hypothetical protein
MLKEIAADVEPWRQALADDGLGSDRHARLLTALEAVLRSCPNPLPSGVSRPDAAEPTARKAALHYRLANEALRAFGDPGERPANLTRGTLFDIWSTWWSAAAGMPPRDVAQRIAERFEQNDGLLRRVVQPGLVLDALCSCDRDVAQLLAEAQHDGGEDGLRSQIVWQMRRVHCEPDRFGVADRVVLYELLHMRHLRQADKATGFSAETLTALFEAAEQTRKALADKKSTVPWASEAAFQIGAEAAAAENVIGREGARDERMLAIAAMQFIVSAHLSALTLAAATIRSIDAAAQLQLDARQTTALELRRLLLRLAARSRMIRLALSDLLSYEFPLPAGRPETKRNAGDLCDCWILVGGHRTTGKSYFMASLTAALLPDDAILDQGATISPQSVEFWKKGRVRLIEAAAFRSARNRSEVEATAFNATDIKKMLATWSAHGDFERTAPDFKNIAEIDTAHMARLRFFDLAGEQIIDPKLKTLGDEIIKALRAMKPAAAVIIDSDDPATNERHKTSDYLNFARLIADQDSPIYIVVNKYDEILKNEGYADEALAETQSSMSYTDAPGECDADFGESWLPFFTLRDMQFPGPAAPDFAAVLNHVDSAPPFARRPYYQGRLRKDLLRLQNLIEALLKAGRIDISLLYLVSARDQRNSPAGFHGHRLLWNDLERRVLRATAEGRRAAIRQLLVVDPIAAEEEATKAYDKLDKVFKDLIPTLRNTVGQPPALPQNPERLSDPSPPRGWTEFYDKIAGYEAAAQLRLAWDAAVHIFRARRELIAGLEDAVRELLLEFGIDPHDKFNDHDFNMARRPLSETWNNVRVAQEVGNDLRNIVEKLETAKLLKASLLGRINAVAELLRKENQEPEEAAKVEVRYDLLKGAQPPLGIAGAPTQDNSLSDQERTALRGANGTFGEAILNPQLTPKEGVTLARGLRNASPAKRYGFLRLYPGERDFNRVRVLSEEPELGNALWKVFELTSEVIQELLSARAELNEVSETLLADWLMAEAIVRVLPARASNPVKKLVEGEDDLEALEALIADAEKLQTEIQKERDAIPKWMRLGDHELHKAGAKAYAGHGNVWQILLPTSEQAVQHKQNQRLTGREKNELNAVPGRLSESVLLLTTLRNAIKRLRDADKKNHTRLQSFLERPAGIWPDVSRPRLVRLRLMRRQLVLKYALHILRAGSWITPHGVSGLNEQNPPPLLNADRRLKNAIAELDSRFPELAEDIGAAKLGAKSIGQPNNTAFSVVKTESGEAAIQDDEYAQLVAALELDRAETKSDASLWGPH